MRFEVKVGSKKREEFNLQRINIQRICNDMHYIACDRMKKGSEGDGCAKPNQTNQYKKVYSS